mmetsp:Transcript_27637/g.60894  ORF Transcript_27637/g.60894 Transcript_27637/m.60894 type:complete len:285 (+) Transcript_27637:1027-1881(+)
MHQARAERRGADRRAGGPLPHGPARAASAASSQGAALLGPGLRHPGRADQAPVERRHHQANHGGPRRPHAHGEPAHDGGPAGPSGAVGRAPRSGPGHCTPGGGPAGGGRRLDLRRLRGAFDVPRDPREPARGAQHPAVKAIRAGGALLLGDLDRRLLHGAVHAQRGPGSCGAAAPPGSGSRAAFGDATGGCRDPDGRRLHGPCRRGPRPCVSGRNVGQFGLQGRCRGGASRRGGRAEARPQRRHRLAEPGPGGLRGGHPVQGRRCGRRLWPQPRQRPFAGRQGR